MKDRLLHTPDGVRDIYNGEYKNKLELLKKLDSCLEEKLYEPISTPTFEYFETFSKEVGSISSTNLYKTFDRDGNTLVLRPDITPSIARATAMYFGNEEGTLRFRYQGNVFANYNNFQGRLKETTQLGAELIGDGTIEADAEVIILACQCLKEAGLKNFKISISHVNVFNALMEAAGFSGDEYDEVSGLIANKNFAAVKNCLEEKNIPSNLTKLFDLLANMYAEPLDWADMIEVSKAYVGVYKALQELSDLFKVLKDADVDKFCVFELGMISSYKYYTGVIFCGYTYGVGEPIVKGGRYDLLLSHYGKDAPACGFAIVVDSLMQAISNQTDDKHYLTFALGKGRLAKKTLATFEKIGITCEEMKDPNTRKLIFVNEELGLRFFLSKGPDVPTYVEYGAADIGVVGEDTILEEGRNLYEVLDLGFGACRMCVCGPKEANDLLQNHEQIRVATKYPHIAKDYFYNKKNQTVEFIKLNGSIELAPIVGLSDVIVDIVETGSTLKENGLVVLEEVCPLSARMVVNQVSMKMEYDRIIELVNKLQEALKED